MEILLLIGLIASNASWMILYTISMNKEVVRSTKLYSFFNYQIDSVIKGIKSRDAMEFADSKINTDLPVETTTNFIGLDNVDPSELLKAIQKDDDK